MNKSGINDGDIFLVRQQPRADNGGKVVALINDEATVKHIYHENGVIMLKTNSTVAKHKPIVLSDEFMIQEVVVAKLPKIYYKPPFSANTKTVFLNVTSILGEDVLS